MSLFTDRLNQAMQLRNLRAAEVARQTGLSKARLSQYTNGIYEPKQKALCDIARVLNVNELWLMGGDFPMERREPDGFRVPDNVFSLEKKRIPLMGEIACGKPIITDEDRESYVMSGTDIPADFCLRAKGDSMVGARILDGDIVFIQQTDVVNNGDIAAVIIDDEATLKRVYYYPERGKLVLTPENPKYEPLVYIGDELNEIHILGKAIAFQSDIK